MYASTYRSPSVPRELLENEEEGRIQLLTEFDLERAGDDSPAPKDFTNLVETYNRSPRNRDLIDTVFVFLSGYTLATLLAKGAARCEGRKYDEVLDDWRSR